MSHVLHIDLETYSELNLYTVGTYNYSRNCEVMLMAWGLEPKGNRPFKARVIDFTRGQRIPDKLMDIIHDPNTTIVIQNSFFDRHVINGTKLFGKKLPVDRIDDTMAISLAHGLPASLDMLSAVFGLDEDTAKMKDGRRLINLFCKPQPKTAVRNTYQTHPEDWKLFMQYARQDITSMREVYNRLPKWNNSGKERAIWELDQKINDRGILIDVDLCVKAVEEERVARVSIKKQTFKATDGVVENATQRTALLNYLNDTFDLNMHDLKADTVERRLNQAGLPAEIREVLELRSEASKNSAAKYRRAYQNACLVDERFRGALQYCGAARTGRWAGRVVQPQNMKRPTAKQDVIDEATLAIKDGTFREKFTESPMDMLGNCVRGIIVASTGRKLVVSDLANIEGRGLTWLAGEKWKLKYFRDFDAGLVKFDNYVAAYAKAMNVSMEEASEFRNRQIGKVLELGLGYGGGVAAFLTFAAVYRLDLQELAEAVWETADQGQINECAGKYEWAKENGYHANLPPFQYAACEYMKQKWREAHPYTVRFWSNLERCFKRAISNPGVTLPVEGCPYIKMRRDRGWLRIRLPSGRYLTYCNPGIDDKGNIFFYGVDQYTRKWGKVFTYSGKLSENVTSATARDVMAYNMPRIEKAGYPIILSVHDEIITEPRDHPKFSSDRLSRLLSTNHEWCKTMPLAAAGFETKRYMKD